MTSQCGRVNFFAGPSAYPLCAALRHVVRCRRVTGPFSEAQFRTLKYHPSFPGRLGDQGQVQDVLSIDLRSLYDGLNRRRSGLSRC